MNIFFWLKKPAPKEREVQSCRFCFTGIADFKIIEGKDISYVCEKHRLEYFPYVTEETDESGWIVFRPMKGVPQL
jgi:hypothetical protein